MHALGFFHQHQAPNRNKFIKVLWGNIILGEESAYRKLNKITATEFGVGYDYNSVMHYAQDGFSKNGKDTIKLLVRF